MKKILFTILALLAADAAGAQNLWIYSVNGQVELFSRTGWEAATSFRKLDLADSLRFGADASVSILDRQNDKLIAVQGEGSQCVRTLLSQAQARSQKQPRAFVSYLWSSLQGNNSADAYRRSAGVVYRDDDVHAALASAVLSMQSSLPVEFDFLDAQTRRPLGEAAPEGRVFVVRVTNHSATDLFVNLIDIDANGNMAACIPVSSAREMAQLLIPAGAAVVLDSFPLVVTGPKGRDDLILVATPGCFDIEAVIAALQSGKTTTGKVDAGVFKRSLTVE